MTNHTSYYNILDGAEKAILIILTNFGYRNTNV
jgi:hypothetical protein